MGENGLLVLDGRAGGRGAFAHFSVKASAGYNMSAPSLDTPSGYLSRMNLALPTLPPIEIDLRDYMGEREAVTPIYTKYGPNRAGACHSAMTAVYCVSFLYEAARTHRIVNGDVLAVCGGRVVAIYGLSESIDTRPFDVLSVWEDEMDEEFYTVRWGVVQEEDGSHSPWVAAGGKHGLIKVFDAHSNRMVKQLCGHKNSIRDLCFLSDGRFLLSCSDDYSVRLWHVPNHVQIAIFHGMEGHDRPVLCLDVHSSERVFLSGGMDRTVKLWSISDFLLSEMTRATTWDCHVFTSSEGIEYSTTPFPTHLEYKPQFSSEHLHKGFVDCAHFYGNFILSKCQEGVIMLWKVNEPRKSVVIIKEFQLPAMSTPCFPLRFGVFEEMSLMVAGGEHSNISVYQILGDRGEAYRTSTHSSVQDDHIVTYTAFSSTAETIVACTNKGALLRFDAC